MIVRILRAPDEHGPSSRLTHGSTIDGIDGYEVSDVAIHHIGWNESPAQDVLVVGFLLLAVLLYRWLDILDVEFDRPGFGILLLVTLVLLFDDVRDHLGDRDGVDDVEYHTEPLVC